MKWSMRLLFALVFSLGFSQAAIAQFSIKWASQSTWTYSYSSGVLSGASHFRQFDVISGNGYVNLNATLGVTGSTDTSTKTTRLWVEEGIGYSASLKVGYSGSRNANPSEKCFEITFDSPDFASSRSSSQTASFNSSQAIWTCPKNVYIRSGEVDEFQLNASDGTFGYHVRVTWNEIMGATSYQVYRCISSKDDSCGTAIGQTSDNGFNDTAGEDEKKYYYRVTSCTASGCSELSDYDRGHRSESSAPPSTPTGISATDGTIGDRVRVSWNDTARATRYKLYRCKDERVSLCVYLGSIMGTTLDDVRTRSEGKPVAETTYWYRVKACNLDNCSSHSEADTGFTGAVLPDGVCNEVFVQMDNDSKVIKVTPTGIDDTQNIQCALNRAVETGFPTVRLNADIYYISRVMVENFKGTLEGRTKTATRIEVVDGSVDCNAMNDSGRESAAIKFVKGEPRIRFMTIRANQPCMSGSIDSILDFSGGSALADDCDNDVIFAAVDRVIIDGTRIDNGMVAAVTIQPEGKWLGGCKDTLLGTFKLNRSKISNTFFGLVTSMKSGAQVDINFNEFRDNIQAVSLYDTNQNTTITSNKFFGDNTAENSYHGITVGNFSDDPPPSSRMVVHNNEFNVSSSSLDRGAYAVSVTFGDRAKSDMRSLVTSNQFYLNGANTYGVLFQDTSNTHVASNRFNGAGARAIYIYGENPVSGWMINANIGLADFTSDRVQDIRLSSSTSNCIVGPGQGALVRDDGTNNTILTQ